MKIEDEKVHRYFVDTVYKILTELKFGYTYEEVEQISIDNDYLLHFKNKITGRWHLGVWAVGKWDIKYEYDGKLCDGGYGLETYRPLTISLFLIHDWTYDKFRPSSCDLQYILYHNDDSTNIIKALKDIFRNPIKSYYNIIDEDLYNFQHKTKYRHITYFKAWYRNVFVSFMWKKIRRCYGYLVSRILLTRAMFDSRVAHRAHKFHKDKWNSEFGVAIVFKYGDTEWDDWKAWNDYDKLFNFFFKHTSYRVWNTELDLTYVDENGNLPSNIWRGVYWKEEPEKE